MEPFTTAALAVGSVIATKALEKTGEKVGEVLIDKIGKFIESLKEQSSTAVTVIERALEEPLDYGEAVIQVESAAQANPKVNQAMQELAAAAKADPKVASKVQKLETNLNNQPGGVTNYTKLAEIIKNVFRGNTIIGGTF